MLHCTEGLGMRITLMLHRTEGLGMRLTVMLKQKTVCTASDRKVSGDLGTGLVEVGWRQQTRPKSIHGFFV